MRRKIIYTRHRIILEKSHFLFQCSSLNTQLSYKFTDRNPRFPVPRPKNLQSSSPHLHSFKSRGTSLPYPRLHLFLENTEASFRHEDSRHRMLQHCQRITERQTNLTTPLCTHQARDSI